VNESTYYKNHCYMGFWSKWKYTGILELARQTCNMYATEF